MSFGRSTAELEPRPASGDGVTPSLSALIALRAEAPGLGFNRKKKIFSGQSGGYVSPYSGRGMEFEEVRIYQPGDDIRHMDWRVTARTGEPHTKVYREERERPVLFVVDQSESMRFGTRVCFKSVAAAKAGAVIAWAASDNHDRVGGIVFDEEGYTQRRPMARRQGALQLCRAIAGPRTKPLPPEARSRALNYALSRIAGAARSGSVIFVLSDFRAADQETRQALSRLAARSELVLILVHDPLEAQPPPPGRYTVTNGEQFATFDASPASFQTAYQQRFRTRFDDTRALATRMGAHFSSLGTAEPLVRTLRAAFQRGAA